MRVIFMGTPEFAVPSLERLALDHEVIAVYVRPDSVSGRGGGIRAAAVKQVADRLDLPTSQPATLKDQRVVDELRGLDADIVCVAAYGLMLPAGVLEAARLGAVNVHASLLPRWRGAAPIQRAILAGDTTVGVSIMRMEEGLDTGPYCLRSEIPVGESSAVELTHDLGVLGSELLVAALPRIDDGTAVWTAQDESRATYAAKVAKSDVAPTPSLSARENVLRVRASLPTSPARVLVDGRGVTLIDVTESPAIPGLPPGGIRSAGDSIALGADPGAVLVNRLKPDGKAEMDAIAWMRGARLAEGAAWVNAR